ncbi:MAG: hypothetical protein HRU03_01745 [Nanoarchaeales archaeon]|nr:hypothetical protein [Nanoarchaeales archaeon]
MNYFLRNIILWTWCLPQTLLGILLYIILKLRKDIANVTQHKDITLITTRDTKLLIGISLGKFIFINESKLDNELIKHEYGHTLQGYYTGPLYIIIIGIPSVFQAIRLSVDKKFTYKQYENSYPEKWADELGGVRNK